MSSSRPPLILRGVRAAPSAGRASLARAIWRAPFDAISP